MTLNFWLFFLRLSSAGITLIHHYAQFSGALSLLHAKQVLYHQIHTLAPAFVLQ